MRRLLLAVSLIVLVLAVARTLAWHEARGSVAAPDPKRDQVADEAQAFDLREVDDAIDAESSIELEPPPAAARSAVEVHAEPSAAARSASTATLEVQVNYVEAPEPAFVTCVSVSRLFERRPIPRLQQAGRDGRVVFDVEPGIALSLAVHAAPDGRRPIELGVEPLAPGERRALAVEVPALPRIEFVGRVLDEGKTPIAGAEVRIGDPQSLLWTDGAALSALAPPSPRVARSDAQGYFELQAADLGFQALRVDAPGFVWTLAPFLEGHRTRELAREVILRRAASLAVELGPLPDSEADAARVSLRPWVDWFDLPGDFRTNLDRRSLAWSAAPGAAGIARFYGIPPGESLDLEVEGIDEQRLLEHPPVRLDPGEARTIDLRRGMGGRLEGSLRDPEGRPHERAEVWLTEVRLAPRESDYPRRFQDFEAHKARSTETDAAGRFRFDDVPDGDWWVGPSPTSDCIAPRAPVSMLHGRADRTLELVATHGLYIEGRAVSWRSNPIASGSAAVLRDGRWPIQVAPLDDAGAFRLGPLEAGRQTLVVRPGRADADGCGDSDPLEVDAGTRDVLIVCPPGASLTARADLSFDASGESLLYLLTQLDEWGHLETVDHRHKVSEDLISCSGLPAGRYDLYAWTSKGRFALLPGIELEPGVAVPEIPLVLSAGAVLRVHCRYTESWSPHVSVTHSNVLVGKGNPWDKRTFEFTVPPGRVHVELRWWEHGVASVLTREVDIPAGGEPVDVVFDDGR